MSEINEELDSLAATEDPETSEQPEAAAPEPEVKAHPAHEKLLAELPEAWHAKVTPYLQEQDKYFQQQIEKYTPYKQFVEDGVDPEYISQSMLLAKAIAEDPITIHNNLTQALMAQGLIKEEAQKQAAEIMDDASEGGLFEEEALTPAMKRELEKRDAELAKIREDFDAQQLEKETEAELRAINNEFNELKGAYDVSPAQERAIIELMDSALSRGENLTVVQAAKKLVEITGSGFKRKGATDVAPAAPVVIGGLGGNGVPFEGVEIPKDDRAKAAMLAEMFKNQFGKN